MHKLKSYNKSYGLLVKNLYGRRDNQVDADAVVVLHAGAATVAHRVPMDDGRISDPHRGAKGADVANLGADSIPAVHADSVHVARLQKKENVPFPKQDASWGQREQCLVGGETGGNETTDLHVRRSNFSFSINLKFSRVR